MRFLQRLDPAATFKHHTHLPQDPQTVWQWHTRPGAVVRLTPGFARMRVLTEAASLRSGVSTFKIAGGPVWTARHIPERFVEGRLFTDHCVGGLAQVSAWEHEHHFAPDEAKTGTIITDGVRSRLPRDLVERVFAYRERTLRADLAHLEWAEENFPTPALTVAVTGASGLVGTQLVALLRTAGHTVIELVRTAPTSPFQRLWDPDRPAENLLHDVDVVVHLAGESIAGRFTRKKMYAIRDSRVGPTRKLATVAANTKEVQAFICASAVGVYGTDRAEPADESATPGEGFLASVVTEWEHACQPARAAGKRVVNVRTGLVLAGGSLLLEALAVQARLGGGALGSGKQHLPWVALDDVTDIYFRAIADTTLTGPVNAVAPEAVTQKQFMAELKHVLKLHLPVAFPIPTVAPKLLLGRHGAEELALADQYVIPAELQQRDHSFRFSHLRDCLAHELGAAPEAS